jgi:hypothetical protein
MNCGAIYFCVCAGRFDLAALRGCHTFKVVCLLSLKKNNEKQAIRAAIEQTDELLGTSLLQVVMISCTT